MPCRPGKYRRCFTRRSDDRAKRKLQDDHDRLLGQGHVGAGPIWATMANSSGVFVRMPISTADNAWHLYTISIPPNTFSAGDVSQIQVGVNQFDSGQTAGSAATTWEMTGAFIMDGNDWKLLSYADVKAGGPLATTTAIKTAVLTKSLPAHMQFRLASALVPDPANPFLMENPSEPWRSGGVSAPLRPAAIAVGRLLLGDVELHVRNQPPGVAFVLLVEVH